MVNNEDGDIMSTETQLEYQIKTIHKKRINTKLIIIIFAIGIFCVFIINNMLKYQKYIALYNDNQQQIMKDISYKEIKLSDYLLDSTLNKIIKKKYMYSDWRIYYITLNLSDSLIIDDDYFVKQWSWDIQRNIEKILRSSDLYPSLVDVNLTVIIGDKIYHNISTIEHMISETSQLSKNSTSDNTKGMIWAITEAEVKAVLKAPSTAKFPPYREWEITQNGNSYTVKAYIDAENSFGAKIRSNFIVSFEMTGTDTYKNVSVIID